MSSTRKSTILAALIAGLLLLALLSVTQSHKSRSGAINLCSQTTDPTLLTAIDYQGSAPFIAKFGTRQGSGLTPDHEVGPWTLTAAPAGIVGTFAVGGRIVHVTSHADIFDGARHCAAMTYDGRRLTLQITSI